MIDVYQHFFAKKNHLSLPRWKTKSCSQKQVAFSSFDKSKNSLRKEAKQKSKQNFLFSIFQPR
jgi:hypothetical protein